MTSREKVLKVYPDAWRGLTGIFIPGHGEEDAIRIGHSWKSIASKLPHSSPAGETASEPVCGYCNGTGEICYSSTSYGPCPECVKRNAVPEPVPTEGQYNPDWPPEQKQAYADHRGELAEPSAPEAAAADDISEEELREIHHGLADVAAGRVKPLSQVRAEIAERQSAAPIAPAAEETDPVGEQMAREVREGLLLRDAEELIQELVKMLNLSKRMANARILQFTTPVEKQAEVARHARFAIDAEHQINTALARAEEYRKGAKNATN